MTGHVSSASSEGSSTGVLTIIDGGDSGGVFLRVRVEGQPSPVTVHPLDEHLYSHIAEEWGDSVEDLRAFGDPGACAELLAKERPGRYRYTDLQDVRTWVPVPSPTTGGQQVLPLHGGDTGGAPEPEEEPPPDADPPIAAMATDVLDDDPEEEELKEEELEEEEPDEEGDFLDEVIKFSTVQHVKDNDSITHRFTRRDFIKRTTTMAEVPSKDGVPLWGPAYYPVGAERGKDAAIGAFVVALDLDGPRVKDEKTGKPRAIGEEVSKLSRLRAELDQMGIGRVEATSFSSVACSPNREKVRLIFFGSREIEGAEEFRQVAEWPFKLCRKHGIEPDSNPKHIAAIFYETSRPAGLTEEDKQRTYARWVPGEPLDVPAILAAQKNATEADEDDCEEYEQLSDSELAALGDLPERKAKRFLERNPPAIEGNHGDAHTYYTCNRLIDHGLFPWARAKSILIPWNSEKNQPPWPPRDLQGKYENALRYRQRPVGCAVVKVSKASVSLKRFVEGKFDPKVAPELLAPENADALVVLEVADPVTFASVLGKWVGGAGDLIRKGALDQAMDNARRRAQRARCRDLPIKALRVATGTSDPNVEVELRDGRTFTLLGSAFVDRTKFIVTWIGATGTSPFGKAKVPSKEVWCSVAGELLEIWGSAEALPEEAQPEVELERRITRAYLNAPEGSTVSDVFDRGCRVVEGGWVGLHWNGIMGALSARGAPVDSKNVAAAVKRLGARKRKFAFKGGVEREVWAIEGLELPHTDQSARAVPEAESDGRPGEERAS